MEEIEYGYKPGLLYGIDVDRVVELFAVVEKCEQRIKKLNIVKKAAQDKLIKTMGDWVIE